MAKPKSVFVCSDCGYESPKWLGKCPACNAWNTFYEEKVQVSTSSGANVKLKETAKPMKLNSVILELCNKISSGVENKAEDSKKSDDNNSAKTNTSNKVLYVSGEESAEQVKLRADRLNIHNENIMFLGETDIDVIEAEIMNMNPKLVVIDSIQTMYSNEITSAAGTVSQVREITSRVMKCCKQNKITTILIGHVTKDGNIAGPRVLEHMVDTVLYLEGERYFSYRILRSVKNRFGSTNEVGMFEMRNEGMCEVTNPSSVLISEDSEPVPGSAIVCSLEGTRPLLVEIQALTTTSVYGIPKRTGNGIDFNKIALLIAVLEKRGRLSLGNQDVYVNVVSGMKINEPAVDLGIALVIASRNKSVYIPKDTAIIGEVGLTGEVRAVNMIDKRLKEAERLGIKRCIIPQNNKKLLKDKYKLDIIGVRNINEVLHAIGIQYKS